VVLARMYERRLNGYCAAKPCICNGTVRNASITGSHYPAVPISNRDFVEAIARRRWPN
jgi:hypothetical protein